MKKTNLKCTLLDTTYDYTYEEYIDNCYDNDVEPHEENSKEFYEWCDFSRECALNNFRLNIQFCDYNHNQFVIMGNVGTWRRNLEIVPVKCDSLMKAIDKCTHNCDDVIVTYDNGTINVVGIHHDGRNSFEIRMLKDYCIDASEREYNNNQNFKVKQGWLKKIPFPF